MTAADVVPIRNIKKDVDFLFRLRCAGGAIKLEEVLIVSTSKAIREPFGNR